MSNEWVMFPCAMGEYQAFISVDVGIADQIELALTNLAIIRLSCKFPNEYGMPTSKAEEFGGEYDGWETPVVT
ncbi:hypothetical protein [Adhaeretor mobilis]|uniref:Uncharacterized protein n=1 Tax=Adhaeretor mobilis TaxID=1930276 RepID=A0A517N009_9BACT|nr:hypothetical protein [Adhaeretor mobilis]QDT00466.1 hypothetical protein HG15A2_38040 [Adhaeretor mobilis]